MIEKHYSIFCDECARSENLVGQTMKECTAEALNMGWVQKKPHWYCPECIKRMDKEAKQSNTAQSS